MFEFRLRQLPAECRPLLNKFYRAHRSHMRVPGEARCWVVSHTEIVAGLCLTRVDEGYWLTGLFVAPDQRNKGLAKRLVTEAVAACDGPVWLFCESRLIGFYEQLGFEKGAVLPSALADRLQRYNRNKALIALWHDNKRTVCALPF
ncbi:GNAT family N-acetyltransferase [Pseudomonas sp. DNDY-54]|uniref:GNAT family N-acetyltransferase n=1 Tax=Pseudomonas sp. DNDY-54 TaxID=2870860 RepID=UPI001CA43BBE|nr:GNAT family N-acetyltransferase [Pseudomonas sp. DNDY-54]